MAGGGAAAGAVSAYDLMPNHIGGGPVSGADSRPGRTGGDPLGVSVAQRQGPRGGAGRRPRHGLSRSGTGCPAESRVSAPGCPPATPHNSVVTRDADGRWEAPGPSRRLSGRPGDRSDAAHRDPKRSGHHR